MKQSASVNKSVTSLYEISPTGTNFNGASIIDDFGNEIPITESMVQASLVAFIKAWEQKRAN